MKRLGFVFGFLVMFFQYLPLGAQETLSAKIVPEHVVLKRAINEEIQKTADFLKNILAPDYKGETHIFKDNVLCGPYGWETLAKTGKFGKIDAIPTEFMIPIPNVDPQKLVGKVLKDPKEILDLEEYVRQSVKADGKYILRAPNPEEFSKYWAVISYDLEEPIFIIDTKSHKFLMDVHKGTVLFFDDLQPGAK